VTSHSFPILEESAVRTSLADDMSVCGTCRLCVDLCDVFPSLFDALSIVDGENPQLLTPHQQDLISDNCFHCGACLNRCPHRGPSSDYDINIPLSFLELMQVRRTNGQLTARQRIAALMLSSPDVIGPIASRLSTFTNWFTRRPGSLRRRIVTALTGISSSAQLPSISPQRFSGWFREQNAVSPTDDPSVSVFPTCVVEYFATDLGQTVTEELNSQQVSCTLATTTCCGAEELRSGRVQAFRKRVRRLIKVLANGPSDTPIMVMTPSCLAHLRTNLLGHCDPDQQQTAAAIVDRLRSPIEVLAEPNNSAPTTVVTETTPTSPSTTVVLNNPHTTDAESIAIHRAATEGTSEAQVIEDAGMTMGAWALRQQNEASMHRVIGRMAERLPAQDDHPRTLVRSGLITSQLLCNETGDRAVDPTVLFIRTKSQYE